ncbi:MAG TPA: GIY-YIG nuclease family protein [Candidatus Ozemobacteraceae bacterium]|nr:GIY-YIG nuclease family protein [Candidatus Ozemobacteraceae bacterium]
MRKKNTTWVVYMVECRDATLYTGITNDLAHRLAMHNAGTGARYTRGRGPVILVFVEPCVNRSDASRRERAIKRLSAPQKRQLINTSH